MSILGTERGGARPGNRVLYKTLTGGLAAIGLLTVALPPRAGLAADTPTKPEAMRLDGVKKDNPSGLALPRFVSLKADKVHVRAGPGTDYPIAWIFQQTGLPVEVIQEFETWRRVRDSEGASGWVFHAMLSGRRTVVVLPWELKTGELKTGAPKATVEDGAAKDANPARVEVYARDSLNSAITAVVEAGVLGNVRTCDGAWCELVIGPHLGFVEQKRLWGVYPREIVK